MRLKNTPVFMLNLIREYIVANINVLHAAMKSYSLRIQLLLLSSYETVYLSKIGSMAGLHWYGLERPPELARCQQPRPYGLPEYLKERK